MFGMVTALVVRQSLRGPNRLKPTRVKMVAGALPYTRYGWLKRALMRRIVKKAGLDRWPRAIMSTPTGPTLLVFAGMFYALCDVRPAAPNTTGKTCACSCGTKSELSGAAPKVIAGLPRSVAGVSSSVTN